MAVIGWILDKSAAARALDHVIGAQLAELAGQLYLCPVGEFEQLYSACSARHYDHLQAELHVSFAIAVAPPDILTKR
ncbi:hypothetical protein K3U93_03265 [Mycobacterium malmoense]|uniref:hypothetical protein n=1 Tax=Mycobacterium malmoense TaxID=1780 RepID=UPI0008F857C1|nr:hypothetical protein [Mycobacterium malmoense]OIN81797.1 hypothetical protein BMG05_06275 [Mycobacterium malmoense]QZA18246.1 hypothetical protein K3U93_03265 [Mycobacterium malmoense]UNB95019.1 hypothetical protein H5T25_03260 [Mycobacterium malmoense]